MALTEIATAIAVLLLLASCCSLNVKQLEVDDAAVLLEFKGGLSQDPLGSLRDWNESQRQSFCSWTGIVCSGNGQVSEIHLGSMQLGGPISPLLEKLHSLQHLNLSQNLLNGSIPVELNSCSSLAFLNLSSNLLSGPISPSLFNCKNLVSLDTSHNFITGVIPAEIGVLQRLQVLRLEANNITGNIPASLGNCSQLREISLIENKLSGGVPEELGRLQNLQILRLYRNRLTGKVPTHLSNCSKIEELLISENHLIGNIPEEYGLLLNLKLLYLWGNMLVGYIPSSLFNCTKIVRLLLDGNNLTGILPYEIGLLKNLEILSIHSNNITGVIPDSIGNCSSLNAFWSHENRFYGNLPKTIGKMQSLSKVSLEKNSLNGWLPQEIGNASQLQVLRLQENMLEGSIPPTLGLLRELQGLSLQSNRLAGNIPPELGSCPSLTYLRLYDNMLTGEIPATFSNLAQLRNLDLSRNRLTGGIPEVLSNCFRLESLDLSYNMLVGKIPSKVAKLQYLLSGFNVSHNLLTGGIPAEFGGMTLVQFIDLSANKLSGEIPGTLKACTALQGLDLSSNNLTGGIRNDLSNLKSLTKLDLSHNHFSGSIPSLLLPNLTFLDVSFNNFEGLVPDSFKNFTSASFSDNPKLCGAIVRKKCSSKGKDLSWWPGRVLVISAASLLLVSVGGLAFYCLTRFRRVDELPNHDMDPGFKKFSTHELCTATENFSNSNIVGVGGQSTIYKGRMEDGSCLAVKKLTATKPDQVRKAFLRELHTLGTLRHRNLGRVVGYCSNLDMMAIILDYMPNGSLEKHLHEIQPCQLSWEVRLNIALGIANGLLYLHHHCSTPVIHCDLKPSNILLDSDFEAHISDFGISKLNVLNVTTSTFKGSVGYIPPEYNYTDKPSIQGDVYSYGIILLELVTGKRPTNNSFGEGTSLHQWVRNHFPQSAASFVDQSLLVDVNQPSHEILRVVEIGLACTRDDPKLRPTMEEVVAVLDKVKAKIEISVRDYPTMEALANFPSAYDSTTDRGVYGSST